MGVSLDKVISLEVSDEEIVERMSGRRVCPKCGASYHTVYNPTMVEGVCDKCGEGVTVRRDDAPEVVQSRLEVYHTTTEPLKDYYAACGKLRLVDGVGTVSEITSRTLNALEV
jgi:adenylate kinase